MIRVHYCRLKKRNTTGDKRGFHSDFETVLMLLMLDDRTDYLASEIAHLICPKHRDPDRYKALTKRIYQRGFRKGLTDHLEPETKGAKATWTGQQWKDSLNDREWHLAVGFFDCLKQRMAQHAALDNPTIDFYFDGEHGLIESDIPHLPMIEALIPQTPWPQQTFFYTWPICSIFRQDLNDDQAAKLAEYEQPANIQTDASQAKTPTKAKTSQGFTWLTRPPFRIWFPTLLIHLALLTVFFIWFRQPTALERFSQLKDMEGPPAIQGLETLLADPSSELDRAWVIAALAEKLKDEPSQAHIQRLRELYRSPHADRDRMTDIIARMQEQVRFDPIFLTDPKQPQMTCAIDHNPMIVYAQGVLRPGDWLNVDDITGYIKAIHFDRMIVLLNGSQEVIRFHPPNILGYNLREPAKVKIYPAPMNLRMMLEAVCEVEGFEAYLGEIDGFIAGAFPVEDYEQLINVLLGRVDGDFDGNTLVLYPADAPVMVIQGRLRQRAQGTISGFLEDLSDLTGYQFDHPNYGDEDFTIYLHDLDLESLFESLDWAYTYDYQSKTVRAKERER